MEIPQEDLDLINSDKPLTDEEVIRLGSYPLKKMLPPEFLQEIDRHLKTFTRTIREELRDAGHAILGLTGYPGTGKSNAGAILACMIDEKYSFVKNICYIPTSKEIETTYLGLPMYSFYHIDEASRGLHKHKWHDKVQQKINELYDTEREGHHLCSLLIMPRFQNFTENFRNFMITVWIHINKRGYAVFYKKDDDKDVRDPWHIDENYKSKLKKWRGKKSFERTLGDKIRVEQATTGYWFYTEIPKIPENVWRIYQRLKQMSRFKKDEELDETESHADKLKRQRGERWDKIIAMKEAGKTHDEIGALLEITPQTVRRNLRQIEAYAKVRLAEKSTIPTGHTNHNIIYNQGDNNQRGESEAESDKGLKVTPQLDEVEQAMEDTK